MWLGCRCGSLRRHAAGNGEVAALRSLAGGRHRIDDTAGDLYEWFGESTPA
jgi:hypothetical protein